MTETRSVVALSYKFNLLSKVVDQHEAEFSVLHQKLDAVTTMLQTLYETVQGFTEVGSGWHQRQQQRPNLPMGHSFLLVQDHQAIMATIPKTFKLEFPRFRGENPSGWIYKANQFFQLYGTPPNQKILLTSYHMEDEALIWFQDVGYSWAIKVEN